MKLMAPGGLRQRLWMDPVPPRKLQPQLPPWLQEVILRCRSSCSGRLGKSRPARVRNPPDFENHGCNAGSSFLLPN